MWHGDRKSRRGWEDGWVGDAMHSPSVSEGAEEIVPAGHEGGQTTRLGVLGSTHTTPGQINNRN